jgi:sulfoxide reductase heme-binding subunit YedZ
MALEFAWYALATGVNAANVFYANFALQFGVRPALVTLLVGLGISAIPLVKAMWGARPAFLRLKTA